MTEAPQTRHYLVTVLAKLSTCPSIVPAMRFVCSEWPCVVCLAESVAVGWAAQAV